MKEFFRKIFDNTRGRRAFKKAHSSIGRHSTFRNPQYLHISKNVRAKNFIKIECFDVWNDKKLEPKLILSKNVIINNNFTAYISSNCEIGEDTIIAHNVTIVTENHGTNPEIDAPYHRQDLVSNPVFIGKNCWIGANVVILPGARLGDNCVVGANSVVNKCFPDNCIIGGSPAKILKRYSFDFFI